MNKQLTSKERMQILARFIRSQIAFADLRGGAVGTGHVEAIVLAVIGAVTDEHDGRAFARVELNNEEAEALRECLESGYGKVIEMVDALRLVRIMVREGNLGASPPAPLGRLLQALMPFAALGGPQDGFPAFHDLADDVVIFSNSGASVTAGDVRAAREAIHHSARAAPPPLSALGQWEAFADNDDGTGRIGVSIVAGFSGADAAFEHAEKVAEQLNVATQPPPNGQRLRAIVDDFAVAAWADPEPGVTLESFLAWMRSELQGFAPASRPTKREGL